MIFVINRFLNMTLVLQLKKWRLLCL